MSWEGDDETLDMPELLSPFPWFGGKARVADEVWRRLGHTPNYVEPFFGSGAVLLARPSTHRWWAMTETINDADGFVANFWRAVASDPGAVAGWADWPVNECDLHARHAWLVERREGITARLQGDPDWCDARAAGWWLWGVCSWIGSGWCSGTGPWRVVEGELQLVGNAGQGINRKLPHLGNAGRGINRKLPHLGDAGRGNAATWSAHVLKTMETLRDRLRRVRICCGDWSRVVTDAVTIRHGVTSVFLDPPYSLNERCGDLYAIDVDIAPAVRQWAIEHGDDPSYRIALCGYDGGHEMPEGWPAMRWRAAGGYGSQGKGRGEKNRHRETIWFSPHCVGRREDLFSMAGVAV